ncbi:MAG: radical SAM protein [Treponema sp.]
MAVSEEHIYREHPCFGVHKHNKGRIHLPVSPGCNIECRFCDRKINATEFRPGVTSAVIKPSEAVEYVRRALERCPEITVAGIAGPGDTLATDFALETFRLIKKEFPKLIRCMSTNGLLLAEKAGEVIEAGIDTLTVTVNAVDPAIEAQLNKRIIYHGKIYTGIEAAEILIENQLSGIEKVSSAGVLVKVNTVLVPTVNGNHIEEIACAVKDAGASIYNIIPLIPQFELKDVPAPTFTQIDQARKAAYPYINLFNHCAHCRADATGVPGEYDIGTEIFGERLVAEETFSHG